jgi:hypothetical protein
MGYLYLDLWNVFGYSGAQFVAAYESSALKLEANALLESGWWSAATATTPQVVAIGTVLLAMLVEASQRSPSTSL